MDTAIVFGIVLLAAGYLLRNYLLPSKKSGCGCGSSCGGCGEQAKCSTIDDAPPAPESRP